MGAPRTDSEGVDLYWRGIKDAEPLSREREAEMFARVRRGDESARQQVVLANLRFVVRVAHGYKDQGLSLGELISEGNVGLLEAVRRFDETRGFKFITYAVWWIRQAILRAIAEHGKAARPSMSQVNDLMRIEKEAGALAQQLGRVPTCDEIAARVEMSPRRVRAAMQAGQDAVSLDRPLSDEDGHALVCVLPAAEIAVDEKLVREETWRSVRAGLDSLTRREHQVLRAYYGLDGAEQRSMEEIGTMLGVTRERVRQLRNRALHKLRGRALELLPEIAAN